MMTTRLGHQTSGTLPHGPRKRASRPSLVRALVGLLIALSATGCGERYGGSAASPEHPHTRHIRIGQ